MQKFWILVLALYKQATALKNHKVTSQRQPEASRNQLNLQHGANKNSHPFPASCWSLQAVHLRVPTV